jgi:hypothetical protein
MLIAALLLAAAAPTVSCTGAADCDNRWNRAVQWVINQNPNITEKTDTFIRNAPISATGMDAYQLIRIGDKFDLRMECANVFSCKTKKRSAEYRTYVMADQ